MAHRAIICICNHTLMSDGDGDPARAFASMRSAGLDVAALTDHATLFGIEGLSRSEWATTGALADAADGPGNHTAIRGFEWSHPLLGHVNVWFTPSYTVPADALERSMEQVRRAARQIRPTG